MSGLPLPSFDENKLYGQGEKFRTSERNTRHEEQLAEAERAQREEEGKTNTLRGRIAGWFRRRR